jgi:hypothetical protein
VCAAFYSVTELSVISSPRVTDEATAPTMTMAVASLRMGATTLTVQPSICQAPSSQPHGGKPRADTAQLRGQQMKDGCQDEEHARPMQQIVGTARESVYTDAQVRQSVFMGNVHAARPVHDANAADRGVEEGATDETTLRGRLIMH